MAELKNTNIDLENIKLSDFVPSNGRSIIGAFLIEGGSLILVKEVLNKRVAMSFFNSTTKSKIQTSERYEQYNGQNIKEVRGDYVLSSKITVDIDSGAESVYEEVVTGSNILYSNRRARYTKKEFKLLWDRFITQESSKGEGKKRKIKEVEKFHLMVFDEKVKFLRSKFRSLFKTRWELGIEPEELFLSKDEFASFDKDNDFRSALQKVLDLESPLLNKSAGEMYSNIIKYCE